MLGGEEVVSHYPTLMELLMLVPTMGAVGLFLFAIGGASVFFGLLFMVRSDFVFPFNPTMGVVFGFMGFLGIGAGLEDIIKSATGRKKES